ncbi:MAG TPA: autotransporter domain-containing protein [Verrucomicrobiae bacterium]|nr:autotransporter domain-containing protein [Verrucomicrobiae bacterium]
MRQTRRADQSRAIFAIVAFAVLLGDPMDHALADTNNWISGSPSSWFTPANWSLAALPSSSDDAFIISNTTATIQGATTATADNLFIENGGVTVGSISAGALTVNSGISIGTLGAASSLTLNLGTISVNTVSVGPNGTYSDTSFGTLALTGTDPTIQMAGSANVLVNSQITGTGGLIKDGLGTLTLAGNDTYSGGTTINLGTLRVGTGGTSGSLGNGDVQNNGALIFNRSDGVVVSALISGSGSLTQSGGGSLTLTGDNTYSGGTTINAGTLQVGDGGTSGSLGTGTITDNSALVYDRSDSVVVSNAISGSGSLTQAGAGTLVLVGTNTFGGRTVISSGTLQVGDGNTSGSLGSGIVSNDSLLVFDRGDSLVVSNGITGLGGVTQAGTGTLVFVASNIYSGQTIVSAGTLQVGNNNASGSLGLGIVSNDAALAFNRTDTILVTNQISGIGSLTQAGTGMLTLSNVNTYSGGTWISDGGTLAVRDSHALGSGNLNVMNGTLKVNTMTINVDSNYTQAGDGTLEIGIASRKEFGHLEIAGIASLDGTVHVVQAGSYLPRRNDTFELLVASNGITGAFSTFTNDIISVSPLLDPKLTTGANDVTLKWKQLSFLPYARTPNQQIVARNLDAAAHSTSASANALVNYLDLLPSLTNNLPVAYDLISPEELGALFTMAFGVMDAQGNQFLNRANELRADYRRLYTDLYNRNFSGGGTNTNSTLVQPTEESFQRSVSRKWDFYVEPAAQFVTVQDDSNASGYDQSSFGVNLGLDTKVNEHLVLGGAMTYFGDDASLDEGGHISGDSGLIQLYGVMFNQGLHLEGMLGGGINSYDTSRGGLQGKAKGSTDALLWTGLLGGGYDWQNGPWSFGPQAAAQYEWAGMDSFKESGSLAPLRISSRIEDALYTQLGVNARYRGNVPGTWSFVTPEISLSWRHDYLDEKMPVTAQLANGAGNVFTVHGPKLGTDSVVGSFGITMQWVPTLSTYLDYVAQLGRTGYEAHTVTAGVRIGF